MANFEQLKLYIRDNIKSNDSRLITGNLLQSALLQIITQLGDGATFKGIANTSTDPNQPDGVVFYFAKSAGIYTNFDNITLQSGLSILHNLNGGWSAYHLIDEQVQANWSEPDVNSKAYVRNKPTIPTKISDLNNDANFLQYLVFTIEDDGNGGYNLSKSLSAIFEACNDRKNVMAIYRENIYSLSYFNYDSGTAEFTNVEGEELEINVFVLGDNGDIVYNVYKLPLNSDVQSKFESIDNDIISINGKILTKEDAMIFDNTTLSGPIVNFTVPQTFEKKYYIINGDVEELNIVLPNRQETKVETIKFYFSTSQIFSQGSGYSITCANDLHPIKFSNGFNIDDAKLCELDITFNGVVYLVSIKEFVSSN